ncbi:MAG: ABC transporter substrate-binding protein, partial [Chloroflexota bacterium]
MKPRYASSVAALLLVSCQLAATDDLSQVTLMLDWVPNTNHSGIFVAQEMGYFDEVGLQVQVIQPGEVFAEQAVVGGAADFGVSFQEQITLARADGQPLVSIGAILQHNSSGFAARSELDATSPADWEGLRYGSFGSPF